MPEPGTDPVEWVRERWVEQQLPDADRFAALASMLRAHQALTTDLDRRLRPFGLNRTMYLLMVTLSLSREGSRPLGYLSRYLMVHPTTVTLVVDQLERRHLVQRQPHPTDRRTSLAVLTTAGRELTGEATAALAEGGFGFDGVDDRTLTRLTQSLRSVRRAIGDAAGGIPD